MAIIAHYVPIKGRQIESTKQEGWSIQVSIIYRIIHDLSIHKHVFKTISGNVVKRALVDIPGQAMIAAKLWLQ